MISEAAAQKAKQVRSERAQGVIDDPIKALRQEFLASLTAIASAAFAVEAETKRIGLSIVRHKGFNMGYNIAAALLKAGYVEATDSAIRDLPWLFNLRNHSIHADHAWTASAQHPSGVRINPGEMAWYTMDAAERALGAAKAVRAVTGHLKSVALPLDPP